MSKRLEEVYNQCLCRNGWFLTTAPLFKYIHELEERCQHLEKQIPPSNVPYTVTFYYMKDNHTFIQIFGTTMTHIALKAKELLSDTGGMLCQPTFLNDAGKELRRVGPNVHSRHSSTEQPRLLDWLHAIENDPDLDRVLKNNTKEFWEAAKVKWGWTK